MFRRFSTNFALLSIALDAGLTVLGLHLAAWLRPFFNPLKFVQEMPGSIEIPVVVFFIFPVVWVIVNLLFSVYDGRRNLRVADEYGSLTLAAILASVTMAGVLYLTYRDISRFLFLTFVLLTWTMMLTWRAAVRGLFRLRLLGPVKTRRIIILGAGEIGRRMGEQIG